MPLHGDYAILHSHQQSMGVLVSLQSWQQSVLQLCDFLTNAISIKFKFAFYLLWVKLNIFSCAESSFLYLYCELSVVFLILFITFGHFPLNFKGFFFKKGNWPFIFEICCKNLFLVFHAFWLCLWYFWPCKSCNFFFM